MFIFMRTCYNSSALRYTPTPVKKSNIIVVVFFTKSRPLLVIRSDQTGGKTTKII